MNNFLIGAISLFYLLFLLGLFTFLLIRGVTHSFIAFFAAGAFVQLIPRIGFFAMQEMPGGFSANQGYFQLFSLLSLVGTICFAVGFLLLAKFLLQPVPTA